MGTKKRRAKRGLKKHANYHKRGKSRRCAHIDRSTGVRCEKRVTAVKSNIRPFCDEHKSRHDPRHKTRVIVSKNNRKIK